MKMTFASPRDEDVSGDNSIVSGWTDLRLRLAYGVLLVASLATAGFADTPVDSAIARLIKAAEVYDESVMRSSCRRLAQMHAEAVTPLCRLVTHENSVVRWKAIDTLYQMGPVPYANHDLLRDRLVEASLDADPDVRAASSMCFVAWFPHSQLIKPIVARLTTDEHPVVQCNAWYCHWRLHETSRSIEELVKRLGSKDWMAADLCERHLLRIGRPAEAALCTEIESANESDEHRRRRTRSVRVLGHMASDDAALMTVLARLLDDPDDALAQVAAKGLSQCGQFGATALAARLDAPQTNRRVIALKALQQSGRAAAAEAPSVARLLHDDSRAVRIAAIATTAAITQPDATLLLEYARLLTLADPDIRAAAASGIGHWGSAAKSIAANVRRIADSDPEDFVRRAAAESLRRIEGAR